MISRQLSFVVGIREMLYSSGVAPREILLLSLLGQSYDVALLCFSLAWFQAPGLRLVFC